MVNWAIDMVARGGKARGDPSMGTPGMEVKKFANEYSQLLQLMLEHAQMEERVLFQIFESADRGLCRVANEEHAQQLPTMNRIKEEIKIIGGMSSGMQGAAFPFLRRRVGAPSSLLRPSSSFGLQFIQNFLSGPVRHGINDDAINSNLGRLSHYWPLWCEMVLQGFQFDSRSSFHPSVEKFGTGSPVDTVDSSETSEELKKKGVQSETSDE